MAAWGAQAGVYWGLLGLVDGTRRMVLVVSVVVRTGDRDLAVPAGARRYFLQKSLSRIRSDCAEPVLRVS